VKKKRSGIRDLGSEKKLFISLLILLVTPFMFNFSFLISVAASSVDAIVNGVQKKYTEIHDMQGDFFQISYLKDLERVEKYEGEFFLKKPSSMRWSYAKPRDEEVVIRDVTTWIYKKSEKQVLRTTFSRDTYSQVPIALLNSLGSLKTDFVVTMMKDGTLKLLPKRKMGYIKNILLGVHPDTFLVKTFVILDVYGNKVAIEVRNVKVNTGLQDSFFIFKAPQGVEVFDLSQ
jgi:outer membrane lipoprotein carrier protein